jgi:hypothetical protein
MILDVPFRTCELVPIRSEGLYYGYQTHVLFEGFGCGNDPEPSARIAFGPQPEREPTPQPFRVATSCSLRPGILDGGAGVYTQRGGFSLSVAWTAFINMARIATIPMNTDT